MTDGSLETIDGRPALRFERQLSHSVERVWRAVSQPAELECWFPAAADWTPAAGETLAVGGMVGEVTEVDAPHRLAWTFNGERYSFELSDRDGGCLLVFTHVFDDRALAAQTAAGWETYLSRLDAHLAGGSLSEEEAHEPWEEIHEGYAARFGLAPARSNVVYYAAMSLDGYIATPDDDLDWLTGFEAVPPGPDVQVVGSGWPQDYEEFYETVGALVSGSTTYEWILEHAGEWAYPGKPYWVLTSRELPVAEGQDVRFNGSLEEMVESAGGRRLWIVGGASVASQFADAGLLDEVIATVVPVVLGAGKPLFERPLPGPPLRVTGSLPRPNGMVELQFEVQRAAD